MHDHLSCAFAIENKNNMCFIFNVINPTHQFKIGSKYMENDLCAEYGPGPYAGIITNTDNDNVLQPFYPIEYL